MDISRKIQEAKTNGGLALEIHVLDDRKIAEFWLTRAERDDEAFRESLNPLYKQYRDKKYTVAVFLSGDEPLYNLTLDLLRYNRRCTAEKEAQAARMDR